MEYPKQESAFFSQTLYKKALECASSSHKEQKTPHGNPYLHHVTSVAMEVMAMLTAEHPSFDEANVALQCALLHDVLEDTQTSEEELKSYYGLDTKVIEGVKALTKDKTDALLAEFEVSPDEKHNARMTLAEIYTYKPIITAPQSKGVGFNN